MQPRISIATLLSVAVLVACAGPATGTRHGAVPPDAETHSAGVDRGDGTPSPWLRSRSEMVRERRLRRRDVEPARRAAAEKVRGAVEKAGDRAVGWWGDLPETESYSALLDPDRRLSGSVSIGTVGRGRLLGGVRLAESGAHHSIIERHRKRNTQWGTQELVDLIRDAAREVADAHPGSTLRVGNLGRPGGGDIPWSSSHNSGRDADLAFYCEDASTGQPVLAPELIEFGPDGRAVERPELRFDVERNWTLVKALLTHPDASMQWLFISESLKQKLLEHARESGEPSELVQRADEVLHQPTDAPPHADHLHLRMTCPTQDRLEGCLDYGPRWDWVDWHRRDLLARSLELARAIRDGDPATQLDALEFLRKIESPYAPEVALIDGVASGHPRVRRAALDLATDIPWWSPVAVAEATSLIEEDDATLEERRQAYVILRRTHSRRARNFALSRLLSDHVPPDERVYAARALSHVLEPGLVPVLIDQLEIQPPKIRAECARILGRITGHREIDSWSELADREVDDAVRKWREWWEEYRLEPRKFWLRRAFAEHGFEGREVFDRDALGELIGLLEGTPDHIAYNANRTLHRITDRWIPYEGWSYDRLHDYWNDWWQTKQNRKVASRREPGGTSLR